jgi:DNA repair exonuclease SbcCD ATPase subunit
MNAQTTVTLSIVSLKSIDRDINTLVSSLGKAEDKILSICNSILTGASQATTQKDVNAFYQKAATLADKLAFFGKQKTVIAFFKGKIPHNISAGKDGHYKLSKLDTSLIKSAETLQAEKDKAADNRAAATIKRQTEQAEKAAKLAKFSEMEKQLNDVQLSDKTELKKQLNSIKKLAEKAEIEATANKQAAEKAGKQAAVVASELDAAKLVIKELTDKLHDAERITATMSARIKSDAELIASLKAEVKALNRIVNKAA